MFGSHIVMSELYFTNTSRLNLFVVITGERCVIVIVGNRNLSVISALRK